MEEEYRLKEFEESLNKAIQKFAEAIDKAIEKLPVLIKEVQDIGIVELSDLQPGEEFKTEIGDFIVLDHGMGYTSVLMKGFYKGNVKYGETSRYETSELKKIFDEEIVPEFKKVFGEENIKEIKTNVTAVDGSSSVDITAEVRPLTFDEARNYSNLIVNEELNDWYWTCNQWSSEERKRRYEVTVVSPGGYIDNNYCSNDNGVRPFCILKSNILVSVK